MGKDHANLETAFHVERYPDGQGRVDVVVHWGAHAIDCRESVPVAAWAKVAALARQDPEAGAAGLLALVGAVVPRGAKQEVVAGFAEALKAVLGL
jgi:hypothetical protein